MWSPIFAIPVSQEHPIETASANTHVPFIAANTTVLAPGLTPEIRLHLASASRLIFQAAEEYERDDARWPPYWAFAWPGGQALARTILDRPELVAGRRVVDIGAGSGIAAIAAIKAGARSVLAGDPDPLAITAILLNAHENGVTIEITTQDLLGTPPPADLFLIGDLVYEPELEIRVGALLDGARRLETPVLLGDRTTARRPHQDFKLIAEYDAPLAPLLIDGYDERARVWCLGSMLATLHPAAAH